MVRFDDISQGHLPNCLEKSWMSIVEKFYRYRRKEMAELRAYEEGETLSDKVSISSADIENGSPKDGDMIARNPKNHDDQWLVARQYFEDNFEFDDGYGSQDGV